MKKLIRKPDVIFALPAAGAGYALVSGGDPALAAQCLDHLKQYLTLLFSRQCSER
jgi:hypothetical protein